MKNLILVRIQKLYEKYFLPLNEFEKEKIVGYFYITLTLFAVSFFGFFAIGPTLNTVSNLNKQYKDNKLILDALETKLKNLKNLDAQYLTLASSIPQIYEAIPKSSKIPQLTRQLENIAAQSNVGIEVLNFSSIELYPLGGNAPIFSYLFTIGVSGNKSDVDKFLSTIINFNRIIGAERIATGKDQEGKFTLSFTGRAFFAPK